MTETTQPQPQPQPQKPLTAIEKIDLKLEQLKARRANLVARETGEQRRQRNRRASILGGWLMANDPARVAEIVAALTRPQDVAAFVDFAIPTPDSVTAS